MEKENQRKEKRVIFARGFDVHIMAIDGTWRRACVINDVSESGAKLTTKIFDRRPEPVSVLFAALDDWTRISAMFTGLG